MSEETFVTLPMPLEDLYLLAVMLKVPAWIGLSDPFIGLPADEAKLVSQAALARLKESGILTESSRGELTIDAAYASMIDSVTSARWIFAASRRFDFRGEITRYIFAGQPIVVEQETMPDEHVELSVYFNLEFLEPRLENFYELPEVESIPGLVPVISQENWEAAHRLALSGNPEKCIGLLNQNGFPLQIASKLSGALKETGLNGSFMVFERDQTGIQLISALSWVATPKYIWQVRPGSPADAEVHLQPVDRTQIYSQIHQAINKSIAIS